MSLKDLGKEADQLQRLFGLPAEVFVVQFNGPISEAVIQDLTDCVDHARRQGRTALGCAIDGQDRARLLRAYGLI